jgi:preprotein translocase subunit SecE
VYPTTIVVIVTTVIFGVALYAVDVIFSRGLALLLQRV